MFKNILVLKLLGLISDEHSKVVKPKRFIILLYKLSAIIFGPTFTIKLLENNEIDAQEAYKTIKDIPEIFKIIEDEERHEEELINMIE